MNLVIFSDPHYRINPSRSYIKDGISSWLWEQIEITKTIFDYAIKHDATVIVNGDIFHKKDKIDVKLYNAIWNLYRKYSYKLEIIINTGNHDIITNTHDSTIRPFMPFINIIMEPTWFQKTVKIVPYGMYDEDEGDILICHEDIVGLDLGSKICSKGITNLDNWNIVFNGHIHKPQYVGNIINIGSIMRQTWTEANDVKRFIHFNFKDNTIESIEIDCPRFYNINKLTDNLDINNRDFYRINVSDEEVSDPIFKKYNVMPNITSAKERSVRLKNVSTIDDDIKEYIKIKNKDLDEKMLLNIGEKIIKEEGYGN